jgi:large subunit ribosomal protein L4
MELKVLNNKGESAKTVNFDDALVKVRASRALLHEVVVAYRAGLRSGTHSVKTRAQVSGGGIKPWRQKGTGRARSGSTRSPLWRKGGIIFGPVARDYAQDLPKKKKKTAFRMAVSEIIKDEVLQVVEPVKITEPKTKHVAAIFAKWKAPTDSLFVFDKLDPNFQRAARNIANVTLKNVETLNTYDCLKARRIFITESALNALKERIAGDKEEAAS